jgi:hypothetical protein
LASRSNCGSCALIQLTPTPSLQNRVSRPDGSQKPPDRVGRPPWKQLKET